MVVVAYAERTACGDAFALRVRIWMPDSLSDTAIVCAKPDRSVALWDERRVHVAIRALVLARPEYFHEWMFVRLACAARGVSWRGPLQGMSVHTGSLEKMGPSATFFTTKELFFCSQHPSSISGS